MRGGLLESPVTKSTSQGRWYFPPEKSGVLLRKRMMLVISKPHKGHVIHAWHCVSLYHLMDSGSCFWSRLECEADRERRAIHLFSINLLFENRFRFKEKVVRSVQDSARCLVVSFPL